MTDIAPFFERLGLEQYLDAFIGEGFETWETVLDIQERDFDALNVKLGHRRKLQRAIADYRGISYERLVGSPAHEGLAEGAQNFEGSSAPSTSAERGSGPVPETKRKYRRHPKPDENAPERPPSAYVIFSNKVREEVKDQNLSFTQIAKLVGDRWQKLDPVGKEPFEAQANAAKERYNIQLSTYRKTDAYKEYMQYLNEFKAKHGQTSEQKRPRLEPESSGSIVSAKSLEVNPDMASSHVRGGSIGSLASSPYIGAPTHSSGSLPLAAAHSRPPLPSSRSGSPPLLQQVREPFRPGLISSHSSVSDESSTVRSDLPDQLMRTAALTLGSASGTPPLQGPPLGTPSMEPMGSPDLFTRSRLGYYPHQQPPPPPSAPLPIGSGQPPGSSPSFPLPLPSPTAQEAAWRSRASEARTFQDAPRMFQPSLPYSSGQQQLSPSQLPPLITPDRLPDLAQPAGLRTLPPPRAAPPGIATLPFLARSMEQPRHLTTEGAHGRHHGQEDPRSALEASESDAANTLAGLAAVVSRPETARPPSQPSPHLPR